MIESSIGDRLPTSMTNSSDDQGIVRGHRGQRSTSAIIAEGIEISQAGGVLVCVGDGHGVVRQRTSATTSATTSAARGIPTSPTSHQQGERQRQQQVTWPVHWGSPRGGVLLVAAAGHGFHR